MLYCPQRPAMPLIFMYHSVSEVRSDPYGITVTPPRFAAQMQWICSRGLRGVRLDELLSATERGKAANLVGLTFDDGYTDFLETAVPIMRRFGFTATVFVVAGRLGTHNDWDKGILPKSLMSESQLRLSSSAGMEIGCHGYVHRRMTELSHHDLKRAVTASRNILSGVVDQEILSFAYPYGVHGPREVAAVAEAGYRWACLASPQGSSLHTLPRTYASQMDGRIRMLLKQLRYRAMYRELANEDDTVPE